MIGKAMRAMVVEKAMSIDRPRPDLPQRLGSDEPTTPVDSGSSPGAVYRAPLEASISRILHLANKGMPADLGEYPQGRGAQGGAGENTTWIRPGSGAGIEVGTGGAMNVAGFLPHQILPLAGSTSERLPLPKAR